MLETLLLFSFIGLALVLLGLVTVKFLGETDIQREEREAQEAAELQKENEMWAARGRAARRREEEAQARADKRQEEIVKRALVAALKEHHEQVNALGVRTPDTSTPQEDVPAGLRTLSEALSRAKTT